jgi:HEPN domain-containing protein
MAQDFMARATARLKAAQDALDRGDYPDVVRYSQECAEFSLKACLRLVGIEYPKEHDVSDILLASADRHPKWFRKHIPEFAEISRILAEARGPSAYGDEARGIPASAIFGEQEAKKALADTEKAYELSKKLLQWHTKEANDSPENRSPR